MTLHFSTESREAARATSTFVHFRQFSCLHVVDEAAYWNAFRDPRVRFDALHLFAHVSFEVVEGMEVGRLFGIGSHLFDQAGFEFVFTHFQQAAVGVVDDDELLRVEQMMGDDERAQSVFSRDASGVADHVRIAGMEAEAVLEEDAGIHAGQYGHVPLGAY